tara:strand:+ start:436 stop:984 length:549 start_codon:yes stop_codon:yes gene_type:complete
MSYNFGVIYSRPKANGLKRNLWELLSNSQKNYFVCIGEAVFLGRHADGWREMRSYTTTKMKLEEKDGSIEIVAESWSVTPKEAEAKVRSYLIIPKPNVPNRPRSLLRVGGFTANVPMYAEEEDSAEAWWEHSLLSKGGHTFSWKARIGDPCPGFENMLYKMERSEASTTDAFVSAPPRRKAG